MFSLDYKMGKVKMVSNWMKGIDTEEGLEEIGKDAVSAAQRYVPVATGRLKKSIGYDVQNKKLYVYADTDYAPFVELGTSKMRAQPYLRPALDEAAAKKR